VAITDLKKWEKYDNSPFFKEKHQRAVEKLKKNPIPKDLFKSKR
jgi:hypothetical protein